VAVDDPPRGREQEREGEVGRRLGQHVGRDADGDAATRSGVQVDVVAADRVVGDCPQVRRGVQQGLVDAVGQQAQQALGGGGALTQLRRVRRAGGRGPPSRAALG
jgi:hypothetical protein